MMIRIFTGHALAAVVAVLAWTTAAAQPADPLPSWNAGKTKQSIVDFVAAVTKPGSRIRAAGERIATFDNDGTLWAEQPMYFQLAFRRRPRQGARAAASGVGGQGAVQVGPRR